MFHAKLRSGSASKAAALALAAAAGGVLVPGALACPGGTIVNGSVRFTQGATPALSTGAGVANTDLRLNGLLSPDQLVRNWCWLRRAGEVREYALDSAHCVASGWGGANGFQNFDYGTFTVNTSYQVVDTGANQGYVVETFTLARTPLAGADIPIDYYCHCDAQVNGTNGNDVVSKIAGVSAIVFGDPPSGNWLQFYAATAPSSYEIGWAAAVLGHMSDGAVNEPLAGGMGPLGPGDVAATFHWDVLLTAAAPSKTIVILKALNWNAAGLYNPDGMPGALDDGPGGAGSPVARASAFYRAYAAGSDEADLDGDGAVGPSDLVEFQRAMLERR